VENHQRPILDAPQAAGRVVEERTGRAGHVQAMPPLWSPWFF